MGINDEIRATSRKGAYLLMFEYDSALDCWTVYLNARWTENALLLRDGEKAGWTMFGPLGGGVKCLKDGRNESNLEVLVRECREEAGIIIPVSKEKGGVVTYLGKHIDRTTTTVYVNHVYVTLDLALCRQAREYDVARLMVVNQLFDPSWNKMLIPWFRKALSGGTLFSVLARFMMGRNFMPIGKVSLRKLEVSNNIFVFGDMDWAEFFSWRGTDARVIATREWSEIKRPDGISSFMAWIECRVLCLRLKHCDTETDFASLYTALKTRPDRFICVSMDDYLNSRLERERGCEYMGSVARPERGVPAGLAGFRIDYDAKRVQHP